MTETAQATTLQEFMMEWKNSLDTKTLKHYVRVFKIPKRFFNNDILWKIIFLQNKDCEKFPLHRKYYFLRIESESANYPSIDSYVTKDMLLMQMIYNFRVDTTSNINDKIKFNKLLYMIFQLKIKMIN